MAIDVYGIIEKFIDQMGYREDQHVLGVFFYGSYLKGFAHEDSDIDLHIVFDNSDFSHMIRGNKYVDGIRIEYFEVPLMEEYMTVRNEFLTQNCSSMSIYGESMIVFDKYGKLKKLQDYTNSMYSKPLPPLDEEEAKLYVSILNNRMERLRRAALCDAPYFNQLYSLTVEKIRKFYHKLKGITKISTSKVYRAYTDSEYRKAFHMEEFPDDEFASLYLTAITDVNSDKKVRLSYVERLYTIAKRDVSSLDGDYRIHIKSRYAPSIVRGSHKVRVRIKEARVNTK